MIEIIRYTFSGLGCLLILISLLPLLPSNMWYVRIFDYPRSQKFWLNLAITVLYIAILGFQGPFDFIFVGALLLNQIYLFRQIWDYTPLAPIQMKDYSQEGETIRLFVANVYQDNRDANRCLALIEKCDPDLILMVETDKWWSDALKPLHARYPHRILIPLENTYGMVFLSRLKIARHEVRYLVDDDIPSIVVDLKTSKGQLFRLYGLHPKPPVPGESEESTERDTEILIVGKEAKQCEMPVIVAGDLNDVAWSYTTSLFLKVSELLDPRIGRGFFSTFHANYRLMRWPLDHVFCSSHFYLHALKRLPTIGSDHFPILIEIGLMPYEIPENAKDEKRADAEDLEVAEEKIHASD